MHAFLAQLEAESHRLISHHDALPLGSGVGHVLRTSAGKSGADGLHAGQPLPAVGLAHGLGGAGALNSGLPHLVATDPAARRRQLGALDKLPFSN